MMPTAPMSPERRLRRLAAIAPAVLREYLEDRCCIAATRAALSLCDSWRIKAYPVLCVVRAANAPYVAHAPGAYALDISTDPTSDGLAGHVVAVGKSGSTKFLLDLSAYQFHRPDHGVECPGGVYVELGAPLRVPWDMRVPLEQGGILIYRSHPRPELAPFETTDNWSLPDQRQKWRHERLVRELYRGVEGFAPTPREETDTEGQPWPQSE
jgi:hypothetical protein